VDDDGAREHTQRVGIRHRERLLTGMGRSVEL
jgi:hypothetical protein